MNALEFTTKEKLYHYTTLDNLILILGGNKLKFGLLSDMNDINERCKSCSLAFHDEDGWDDDHLAQIRGCLKTIRQISFTQDGEKPGFAISNLWGHYADNTKGVCIVFDKQKLLERCNALDYKHSSITYTDDLTEIIYDSHLGKSVPDYIEKECTKSFFEKTTDWSCEQEYRILGRFEDEEPHFLDISDCIIAVLCMYNQEDIFKTQEYIDLKNVTKDIPLGVFSNTPLFGLCIQDEYGNDWLKGDDWLDGWFLDTSC